MIKSSVFDTIKDLSKKKFGSSDFNSYMLLYGYSVVTTMSSGVLGAVFTETEIKEVEAIKELVASNNLNMGLIKSAVPILLDQGVVSRDGLNMEEAIQGMENKDGVYSSVDILKEIIKQYLPDKQLFGSSRSMADIYEVVKKHSVEKREQDADCEEEKPHHEIKAKEEEEKKAGNTEIESGMSEDTDSPKTLASLLNKTELLYDQLQSKIIGQNEAIRMFAEGYFQSEIFQNKDEDQKGPSASFLFAGPPGVGKTYLSSCAAENLGLPFLRIDLSEYCNPDSVQRLTGVPPTFQGKKPGILTEFVRKNPRCLVLLDATSSRSVKNVGPVINMV